MGTATAIKRLTASDLTLFESFFRTHAAGNQKAVNLNASVFVDHLYPALLEHETGDTCLDVDLTILGPGGKPPQQVSTKIIKGAAYKNWRMGGATVASPEEDEFRYSSLEEHDLAVLQFAGSPLPTAALLLIVSRQSEPDLPLYECLSAEVGSASMIPVSHRRLAALATSPALNESAALDRFLLSHDSVAAEEPPESLAATTRADQIEHSDCQELAILGVTAMLSAQLDERKILDFRPAAENDEATHTFFVKLADGADLLVGVKATAGEFNVPVSISTPELVLMRDAPQRYDLYYVFEFGGHSAKLRIATDLRGFAQRLLPMLAMLPDSIVPESFAIKPDILSFGDEQELRIPPLKIPVTSTRESINPPSRSANAASRGNPDEVTPSTDLSEVEVDQVMTAFRAELRGAENMTEKDVLRAVARRLGCIRLTKNARAALKGHLRAAIRRQIAAREGPHLVLATPIFRQYEQAFLVKTVCSVMRPGYEYERDEVVRLVASYLGFTYPTRSIHEQMKSTFNSAIRQGLLSYQGSRITRCD